MPILSFDDSPKMSSDESESKSFVRNSVQIYLDNSLKKVVFPEAFAPTIEIILLSSIVMLKLFKMFLLPKDLFISET